MTVQTTRCWI